jgi:hypothetical protein
MLDSSVILCASSRNRCVKKVFAVVGNSVIFPVVPVACIARCALARKCAHFVRAKCVYGAVLVSGACEILR